MEFREKSDNPPFLEQPPLFSFLPPFYANFPNPPLSGHFENFQPPPLGRGGYEL